MPFVKGQITNPNGRSRKGFSLRELLRNHPIKDKRELVKVAYRLALGGDVHWAEWIARHSGEGAAEAEALPAGSEIREIRIREVRYASDGALTIVDALSGAPVDSDTGADTRIQLPPGSTGDVGP